MAQLIIFVILLILAWVFVVLPQRRRVQAHRAFVAQIQVGDEVVTTAGVYGVVTRVEPDVVGLEVAPDVEITIARLAIGRPQPLSAEEQRAAMHDQIDTGLADEPRDADSADAPTHDPDE